MTNIWRRFNGRSYGRVESISIIVFFMPVFFLTVKSWVTTSLFLLFFTCLWLIISNPTYYFSSRTKQFWLLLLCLITPFFAELLAQAGRGELIGSSLDGPSRMLLAATTFVCLSRVNVSVVIRALSFGAAFGILTVLFSLLFFPGQYWQHRAARYFVDPITLPCFTVGLLGLFLFSCRRIFTTQIDFAIKLILIFIVAFISIESGSRSAWVAFASLLFVYVLYLYRRSFKSQVFGITGLLIGLVALYFFSDTVYNRTNESASGVLAFFLSSDALAIQTTSSGQRLVLGLIDIHLILGSPLFGLGDRTSLPPYEVLMSSIPFLTREIYEIKILAGSHSEILAQLVRQGIVFGSATLWGLFLYPLYVFVWKFKNSTFSEGSPLAGAIGIIIPILVSSLTIQVFNLKMTISFYGLCLAIFFAYLCSDAEREKLDS